MTPIRQRMLEAGSRLGMTPEELDKQIEEHLKDLESGTAFCPWDIYTDISDHSMCKAMFPKLRSDYKCPIDQFSLPYVRRRAREALK